MKENRIICRKRFKSKEAVRKGFHLRKHCFTERQRMRIPLSIASQHISHKRFSLDAEQKPVGARRQIPILISTGRKLQQLSGTPVTFSTDLIKHQQSKKVTRPNPVKEESEKPKDRSYHLLSSPQPTLPAFPFNPTAY